MSHTKFIEENKSLSRLMPFKMPPFMEVQIREPTDEEIMLLEKFFESIYSDAEDDDL